MTKHTDLTRAIVYAGLLLTAALALRGPPPVAAPAATIAATPADLMVRLEAGSAAALDATLTRFAGEVRYRSAYTDGVLVRIADRAELAAALTAVRATRGVRDAWAATPTHATAGPVKLSRDTTTRRDGTDGLAGVDANSTTLDPTEPAPSPAPAPPPPGSGDGTGNVNPHLDDLASWGPTLALTEQPVPDPTLAPLWDLQWNLKLAWVGYAWSIAHSLGDGVKVAVLDSGVSPTASLPARRIARGADFIDPGTPPADEHGHGTHMATIIAGQGFAAGVAPAAIIVPVRVLDADLTGTELALVDGLHYAASRADVSVVNLSLSFPAGYYPSPLLSEAIDAVRARGIVMVGAAGNDSTRTVGYPARFPDVIAVGAQTLTVNTSLAASADEYYGSRPAYSNTGGALDLSALGGDLTQDVDRDGLPDAILGERAPVARTAGGLWLTAGTSPAAAEVSGAAALLIANGVAPRDVRALLDRAAYRGYATGNFSASDGAGLLNVGRALELGLTGATAPDIAACFANPVVLFLRDKKDASSLFPAAIVEVTNAARQPIANAAVYVHFGGQHDDHVVGRTNSAGQVLVTSSQRLAVGAGLVAVTVDAVVAKDGRTVCRPVGTVEVDRLSYELISNLGAGLTSSALVLDLDPYAVARLPLVDPALVTRTLQLRSLGAGTAALPIVFGATEGFYDHVLAGEALVFRTWGTGLIASAVLLDRAFFRQPVRHEWATETVTVRSYTTGSGLTGSALVWQGGTYPLDTFFTGVSPKVFTMISGSGLISSALIWDGANLLSSDLTLATRSTMTSMLGMASATTLRPFDKITAGDLGASWSSWSAAYPSGTGLISSALVARFDPYRQLARTSGFSIDPLRLYRGTSDAAAPLTVTP